MTTGLVLVAGLALVLGLTQGSGRVAATGAQQAPAEGAAPQQRTPPPTSTPRPTEDLPTRTPTVVPTGRPGGAVAALPSGLAAAAQVWLPALTLPSPGEPCAVSLTVQNPGRTAVKAILVVWGADSGEACPSDCPGPAKVECSGLIRPGSSWVFIGQQMPWGAVGGALYSVTTKTLREIGVEIGVEDVVADYLCETLFFGVVGDCRDDAVFRHAFNTGGSFAALPMDRVYGGPLVARVTRTCPGEVTAPGSRSSYEGVSGSELGRPGADSGAFSYHLPAVDLAYAGTRLSTLAVQNAGLECATAKLFFKAAGDCDAVRDCGTIAIQAGMTALVPATACGGPNLRGSAWLESDQPLAVVVDTDTDFRDRGGSLGVARHSYTGLARPVATQALAADGAALLAPVAWGGEGQSGELRVQNLSPLVNAQVRVYGLDRSGDTITTLTEWICPNGSHVFDLAALFGPGADWRGSLRVESLNWASATDPDTRPPRLAGLITLRQSGNQEVAYPLVPFDPPAAAAHAQRLLAVPELVKDAGAAFGTEMVILNLVSNPGYTNLAILVFDQNGPVDFICLKLHEQQVEYINLQTWGYVSPGFKGSAIISAVSWEHERYDTRGQVIANPVGLGAVTLLRPDRAGAGPQDLADAAVAKPVDVRLAGGGAGPTGPLCGWEPHPEPTNTPSPATAAPQPTEPPASPTPQATVSSQPPPLGTPTRTGPPTPTRPREWPERVFLPWAAHPGGVAATATPEHTLPPASTATHTGPPTPLPTPRFRLARPDPIHLPVLNFLGEADVCTSHISVQNLGTEPSKAVFLTWGEAGFCPPQCAGPLKLVCSGLMAPGGSWSFLGSTVPTGSRSGALYSLTAQTFAALGIEVEGLPGSTVVADYLCEALFFGVVGDCDDYRRFKLAFESGSSFARLPLGQAWGAPIAATVLRTCPGQGGAGGQSLATYNGLSQADSPTTGAFIYVVPGLGAEATGPNSQIHLQNVGLDCAGVEVWLSAEGDCLRHQVCHMVSLAPGESTALGVTDCVQPGWRGSARIQSTQALAIVADASQAAALASFGVSGNPADSLTLLNQLHLVAPLAYDPRHGWDLSVHVNPVYGGSGPRVKVELLDATGALLQTQTEFLCSTASREFRFPAVDQIPGPAAASVRVLSEPYSTGPDTPPAKPWPVNARLTMRRGDNGDLGRPGALLAYELLPLGRLGLVAGSGPGGPPTAGTAGRVALPKVFGAAAPGYPASELVVTNLVRLGGTTRYQVRFLADGRGSEVAGTLCDELPGGAVRYYDVDKLATVLPPDFRGSAIVSATWWQHPDAPGAGNWVGLGAVAVQRPTGGDGPGAGDLAIAPGIPFAGPAPERGHCP